KRAEEIIETAKKELENIQKEMQNEFNLEINKIIESIENDWNKKIEKLKEYKIDEQELIKIVNKLLEG
ncbi:MAG: hypothetical protein QXT21_04900, partial [Thermoplasmata archaeon]